MPQTETPPPIANIGWSLILGIGIVEVLFAVVVIGSCWLIVQSGGKAIEPASAPPIDAAPIRKVLDDQVSAWNRGDLDGFMAGYWKSDDLSFYSGGDITKGWQATLERYRRRYQAEGKAMGKLTFSNVDVQALTADHAFVRGRWKLALPDGTNPEGLFTLFMKRVDGNWRVVHDHTSAKSP
jgi:ketosteroid isomerase-like protein